MKPETLLDNLIQKAKRAVAYLCKLDWTNPKNVIALIAVLILPFAASYYILSGLALGLILSFAILVLLDKSPEYIKQLVKNYPLASDIILSSFAVYTFGGFFGKGLTLGIGAVFCAAFLSLTIPYVKAEQIEEDPNLAFA